MPGPAITVRLDDGSGTFPFDITSKVLNVDGYDIGRGRDDWQGAVTAGELRLTLNNSDGRFTPGSTILATPSPIKVDQRIRVSTVGAGFDAGGFDVGGFDAAGVRFTGYVKSWPVEWPAVVTTFATVSLTATDAQARGERRTLRSLLEEEILSHSATVYYTLSEAEGATGAGDSSGSQGSTLVPTGSGAPLTFGTGTGPGVDGLTAVQLFGGQYLAGIRISPSNNAVVVFVATTASNVGLLGLTGTSGASLRINSSGKVEMFVGTTSVGSSPSSVNDGLTRAIALWFGPGAGAGVYIDGVLAITSSFFAVPFFSFVLGADVVGNSNFAGTMSHFALINPTSAADLVAISAAAQGFTGNTGTQRIARIAGYAGLSMGALDTSLTNVPAQQTSGRSAWDAIQEVADAEMGLVFVDGSGNLTFHNRTRVNAKTAPDLVLDSQYVTPDVQPVTDDQQIVNYFEATAAGTGAPSVARNTSSETTHGRYPVSETYLVQTDAEALDRANWIVAKQAEPTARYGTLTINLFKMTASLAASVVAAIDLDCWLRVTSMASQNPGGTVVDVVVQGWHEEAITGVSWTLTCNVVSRSLYTAFVLDSSLLDSTTLLAV